MTEMTTEQMAKVFPTDKQVQLRQCLTEMVEGAFKFGSIELKVNDGKIVMVSQLKRFDRST